MPRGGAIIDVIEQLGLEEYLYGVLPREVGSDWPVESLKAQAVISRTYVVANVTKSNGKGYDVSNDVFSQVYGGLQDENPASNQAVEDTRGRNFRRRGEGTPVRRFSILPAAAGRKVRNTSGRRSLPLRVIWKASATRSAKTTRFTRGHLISVRRRSQRRLRRVGIKVGKMTKDCDREAVSVGPRLDV